MSGLESMNLGGGASPCATMVDGYSITERTPAADSIQKIGGIDGLRVTMHKLGVLISGSRRCRVDGSRPRVASTGRVDGIASMASSELVVRRNTHAPPAAGTSSS